MTAEAIIVPAAQTSKPEAPRRRSSLAMKFALAFIGLVTLVLVVNGAVNLWLSYQEAKSAAVQVQREKAQAAAERIDLFISGIEQQMGWTTRAEWSRVTIEQRRYDFIRLLRQAPAITELIHVGGDGKEQLKLSRLEPDAVASGADYSSDPRFTGAIASKTWFGPVTFRRGSEPYMTIAVSHAGRMPGVTIAEVNLKLIWDVVTSIKVGEGGYAFIVDANGRLVAHPDMSLVLRETDMATVPQVAQDLAGKDVSGKDVSGKNPPGRDVAVSTSLDGKSVLIASAPIARLKWFVFVQLPLSEALAPVYDALVQTAALLGLGIVLASIMGGMLANRMVIPIQRLQAGAERLGAGALDERIDIHTGDEIETLADRFNQMASSIRESYETLEARVAARTSDLNEALEQQTATSDVLNVISRSPSQLQPVLDAIADTAARLCGSEQTMFFRYDGTAFRILASWNFPTEVRDMIASLDLKPGHPSAIGRAGESLQPAYIPDVLAYPAYGLGSAQAQARYRATLAVPMLREGRLVGALSLNRSEPGSFTSKHVELVKTFADQAVIAIENVRLFEEVQARTHDLQESLEIQTATGEVLSVISRSPDDLQPVLDVIARTSARICEAQDAHIYMMRDGAYRQAASTRHAPDDTWQAFTLATPIAIDMPGSATSRAARELRTVHVPDTSADPEHDQGMFRDQAPRTVVSVPLIREGKAVGVITLNRETIDPFTPRQIELLTTFADQAVIAIANTRLFEEVQARTKELQASLASLRATQDRLVQSEKLASLGQLTAGIAHEIKNPLNFVNNFSSLSSDLIDELNEILEPAPLDEKIRAEIDELTGLLKSNLAKVVQHGKRADSIVKNMLLHSREGSGERRLADLNALVEESINLAYHGARAEKPGFNVTIEKRFDSDAGDVDLYPQEITRVLLNLVSNGFYATAKRKDTAVGPFEPTLSVETEGRHDTVTIRIRDNGTGIPESVKAKMFNPFFTTKPAGEGTGLGLSLSHDIIVKQHGGTLEVDTELGAYTQFTITLPRKNIASGADAGGAP